MQGAFSKRYSNQGLNNIVIKLERQAKINGIDKQKKIKIDRKAHQSCMDMKGNRTTERPIFNNKTKHGSYFCPNSPNNPYIFIPKDKSETFIMPDRSLQKGKGAKRMLMKMKDTSIFSFHDGETQRYQKIIHKQAKDKIIFGRKMEELNRILDSQNGKEKAKKIRLHLRNRKIFHPPSPSKALFDVTEPILSPREEESVIKKKISLTKTFDYTRWKPTSTISTFSTPAPTMIRASKTQPISFR